ncbi:MAG: hypothetical protein ACK55Z_02495, partial [bacterium]
MLPKVIVTFDSLCGILTLTALDLINYYPKIGSPLSFPQTLIPLTFGIFLLQTYLPSINIY